MGADYYAKAVIGILLPDVEDIPKLKKLVRKKAFKHDFEDDGEHEFDSKTAKKLFLDEKEEIETDIPAFVFDDDLDVEDKKQIVIKPPKGMSYAIGTDDSILCLGATIETGDSNYGGDGYEFMKILDVNDIKGRLKKLLEPHGLWDEEKFGLHVILYCSY
jgi:hypothetical protein